MEIEINTRPRIRIINIYAPHAGREEDLKDRFYLELQKKIERQGSSKPTYIVGDLNVRLHDKEEDDGDVIGK